MAELDTGVGSSVTSRTIVRFTTNSSAFPASTQTVSPSVPDTGTGTTVTARNDVFDEFARTVNVSPTGATFATSAGGPA